MTLQYATPPTADPAPAVPDFFNPPASGDDSSPDAQTGDTGGGLSLIRAEDLTLVPGVPVLDSNDTARPFNPARAALKQVTDAAAAGQPATTGAGTLPGGGNGAAGDGTQGTNGSSGAGGGQDDAGAATSQPGATGQSGAGPGAAAQGATGTSPGQAGGSQGDDQPLNNQGDPDPDTKAKILRQIGGTVTTANSDQAKLFNVSPGDIIGYDDGHGAEVRRLTQTDIDDPGNAAWVASNKPDVGSWAVLRGGVISDEASALPKEMGFYAVSGELTLPLAPSAQNSNNKPPAPPAQPTPPQVPPAAPAQPTPPQAPPAVPAQPQGQSAQGNPPQFAYPNDYSPPSLPQIPGVTLTPAWPGQWAQGDAGNGAQATAAGTATPATPPGNGSGDVTPATPPSSQPRISSVVDSLNGAPVAGSGASQQQAGNGEGAVPTAPDGRIAVEQRYYHAPPQPPPGNADSVMSPGQAETDFLNSLPEAPLDSEIDQFRKIGRAFTDRDVMQALNDLGLTPERMAMVAQFFNPQNPDGFFALMNRPLINIPAPGADYIRRHPYLGGMAAAGSKFASGFTSPLSIILMVGTGGLGATARELMGMGFAAMNAKQIAEQSAQFIHEKDPEKQAELAMSILLMLAMGRESQEKMPSRGGLPGEFKPGGTGLEVPPWEGNGPEGGGRQTAQGVPGKPPPPEQAGSMVAASPGGKKPNPDTSQPAGVSAGGKAVEAANPDFMQPKPATPQAVSAGGGGKGNEFNASAGESPQGGGGEGSPSNPDFLKPKTPAPGGNARGKGGGGSPLQGQGEKPPEAGGKSQPQTGAPDYLSIKPITRIMPESVSLWKRFKTSIEDKDVLIGFIQNGKVILKPQVQPSGRMFGHRDFTDTGLIDNTPDLLGFVLWKSGGKIKLHPFSELNTKIDPLNGELPKATQAQLKNILGI